MAPPAARDLITARLRLSPLAPTDAGDMRALWNNREVRRYLWDDRIMPEGTVRALIDDSTAFFQRYGSGFYSVRSRSAPEAIIGFCGTRPFEETEETELLYGLHPDYWSRGLGTEAARAVLEHVIERCGFERIIAATDTPNQRSVKVLQRLGMFFDRRQNHHGLDTVFYSIRADDFTGLKKHG